MASRKHPFELEEEEDESDSPETPERAEIHEDPRSSRDGYAIDLNLSKTHYTACLQRLFSRAEIAHAQFQQILTDFNDPDDHFPSKKERIKFFEDQIKYEEARFFRMKGEVEKELDELWFFVHESPLKIIGALFNAPLAKRLLSYRRSLNELFDKVGESRLRLDRELANTQMLLNVCKNLVRPNQNQNMALPSSGLLMPNKRMEALVNPDGRRPRRRRR